MCLGPSASASVRWSVSSAAQRCVCTFALHTCDTLPMTVPPRCACSSGQRFDRQEGWNRAVGARQCLRLNLKGNLPHDHSSPLGSSPWGSQRWSLNVKPPRPTSCVPARPRGDNIGAGRAREAWSLVSRLLEHLPRFSRHTSDLVVRCMPCTAVCNLIRVQDEDEGRECCAPDRGSRGNRAARSGPAAVGRQRMSRRARRAPCQSQKVAFILVHQKVFLLVCVFKSTACEVCAARRLRLLPPSPRAPPSAHSGVVRAAVSLQRSTSRSSGDVL